MIQGTTPILTFTIKNQNVNFQEAQNIYVSIVQDHFEIIKTGEDLEVGERRIEVRLTQQESFRLCEGKNAEVQINWTYYDIDGITLRRAATRVRSIRINKQLLKRVIE